MNTQDAANNILIDLDAESQRDLLGNAGTAVCSQNQVPLIHKQVLTLRRTVREPFSNCGSDHICKFTRWTVNKGKYGNVSLDGAKFGVAGDLGSDFSMGQMDWAVLHFDPSVKKEQRDGIAAALTHLYPVKWNSFKVGDDYPMEWSYTKDRAVATLNGGRAAEVILKRMPGNTDRPIVISNLKYWGAPRNEGFVLMPNEIEAYRLSDKAYEFKGTNGFMITFDIASKDVKK